MKSSSSGRLPRTASYSPEIRESHTAGPRNRNQKKERKKKRGGKKKGGGERSRKGSRQSWKMASPQLVSSVVEMGKPFGRG